MKKIKITMLLLLVLLPANIMAATYNSAMNAYDRNDYSRAMREFTQLSQNNDPYAQYMLGQMYTNGSGVRKDLVQAYKWLQIAENQGIQHAGNLKNNISKRMSHRQVNQAKRLAEDWRASNQYIAGKITDRNIIIKVQQQLARKGYFHDSVDGIAGYKTQNAIRNYQRNNRLHANGVVTSELLKHLGITQEMAQNGQNAENQELKQKLKRVIRSIKKKNAAEPWVIKRLEKLVINDTENPWPNLVINDDFSEYGNQHNLNWQVISGFFQVQQNHGIVGYPNNSWSYSSNNSRDIGRMLLTGFTSHPAKNGQKRIAKIVKDVDFSNAFNMELETANVDSTEGLILSCNTDNINQTGYRLVFKPGKRDKIKLLRIGKTRTTEIKKINMPINIEGNGKHTIRWSRSNDGDMTVYFDNEKLIEVRDKKLNKQFKQVSIAHVGKEITIKRFELSDSGNRGISL